MTKKAKILLTGLSVLVLLLVLVNIFIGIGNQSIQSDVSERARATLESDLAGHRSALAELQVFSRQIVQSWGRDFDIHLVRLELDDGFARGHGLALLLEPPDDARVHDGLANFWNDDVDRHDAPLPGRGRLRPDRRDVEGLCQQPGLALRITRRGSFRRA